MPHRLSKELKEPYYDPNEEYKTYRYRHGKDHCHVAAEVAHQKMCTLCNTELQLYLEKFYKKRVEERENIITEKVNTEGPRFMKNQHYKYLTFDLIDEEGDRNRDPAVVTVLQEERRHYHDYMRTYRDRTMMEEYEFDFAVGIRECRLFHLWFWETVNATFDGNHTPRTRKTAFNHLSLDVYEAWAKRDTRYLSRATTYRLNEILHATHRERLMYDWSSSSSSSSDDSSTSSDSSSSDDDSDTNEVQVVEPPQESVSILHSNKRAKTDFEIYYENVKKSASSVPQQYKRSERSAVVASANDQLMTDMLLMEDEDEDDSVELDMPSQLITQPDVSDSESENEGRDNENNKKHVSFADGTYPAPAAQK